MNPKLKPTNYQHLSSVVAEGTAERLHQDLKWGGIEHDDEHTIRDFVGFMVDRLYKVDEPEHETEVKRRYLVEVMALAIAAIQKIDRATGNDHHPFPQMTLSKPEHLVEGDFQFWSLGLYTQDGMLGTVYGDTEADVQQKADRIRSALQFLEHENG